MILSVSRRTDIPAFYAEWFMNRLRQGYVYVRNPMNYQQLSNIRLTPDNVDCIVFWTKDPLPLFKYLDEIDRMQYKYYFQFTVTPYDKEVEAGVRSKADIIKTFQQLSSRIGKEKVILRYDPILLTDKGKYNIAYHVKAFEKLCGLLRNDTERVVISFLDGYKKIAKNMNELGVIALKTDDMLTIAESFAAIVNHNSLRLETCAEKIDLAQFGIHHAKCIDGTLIERIVGSALRHKDIKDANREHCGCMKCIDIGQYDTCNHRCVYCYATYNREKAAENYKRHDPSSPILLGEVNEALVKVRNEKETGSFKITDEQISLSSL